MTATGENSHAAIIPALSRVPAVRLVIYDLARELTDQDGQIDTLRASERAEDILAAAAQAEAYVHETQMVLRQLTPRRRGPP